VLPGGRWMVEVRYDNLQHEGEGGTETAALIDAILHISETVAGEH
jgi:hypothetical protein